MEEIVFVDSIELTCSEFMDFIAKYGLEAHVFIENGGGASELFTQDTFHELEPTEDEVFTVYVNRNSGDVCVRCAGTEDWLQMQIPGLTGKILYDSPKLYLTTFSYCTPMTFAAVEVGQQKAEEPVS